MSLPAMLVAAFLLKQHGAEKRDYIRMAAISCAAFAAVILVAYGFAFVGAHVDSYRTLMAWMHEATQDSRDRKAIRLVSGMARGVYEMGNDAVWLKWFVFHDPYANVGVCDLFNAALVKISLFYLSLGGLCLGLLRTRFGRRLLAFLLISMAGHLVMALTYESGSVERYLPFLPAVWLGFGWLLAQEDLGRDARIALAVLCSLHIPFNLAASVNAKSGLADSIQRVIPLLRTPPHSRVWVIGYRDGIVRLEGAAPFEPINRDPRMPDIGIIQQSGLQLDRWRMEFSCQSLSTFNHGGEVWITNRVLATEPRRAWLWVEHDDPRQSWKDLHYFFQRFSGGRGSGGEDGFFQLADTPEVRLQLLADAKSSDGTTCPTFGPGSWRRPAPQPTNHNP
jgi:hypothetical protein